MGNTYSENRICNCQLSLGTRGRSSKSVLTPLEQPKSTAELVRRKSRSQSLNLDLACSSTTSPWNCDNTIHCENVKVKEKKDGKKFDSEKGRKEKPTTTLNSPSPLDDSFVLSDLTQQLKSLSVDTSSGGGNGSGDGEELPKVHYFGWFFSPETSEAINRVVMHLYQLCLKDVSQFERFISNCCKEADVRDPTEFYNYKRPGKKIKPDEELEYHVTAKFLGKVRHPEYQNLVSPYLDKSFYIHLVGIVFTPRTLGVRVKLTPAQQLMFDEKDEHRNGRKFLSSSDGGNTQIQKAIDEELKSHDKLHRVHKGNPKCKFKEDESKIIFNRLSDPLTNSRAHVTIACAPNVLPKRTGDDLVELIDLEQRPISTSANFQQDYKIKHGTLRQFGRQAEVFVLYPDWEMIVPGVFNSL